jgi:septal ring factor EnvC (AmiA/AmiB activator)
MLPEGFEPFEKYIMPWGRVRYFKDLFVKMTENGPEFITHNSQNQYRRLYENVQKQSHFVNHRDIDGKACHIFFSSLPKTQNDINTTQQQINQTQATIAETQKQIAEAENNLSKVLLNMTEIIKNQRDKQTHPEEETSDEEYEHFEPDEDYKK